MSFSLAEILDGLSSLDVNSGPGIDGISNFYLRKCSFGLAKPLLLLINKSLNSGIFPDSWKTSLVRSIHKGGNKNNVKNFRPIALINTVPKLFEKLVTKKINILLDNKLTVLQHGFRPGKSTSTNLVIFNDYLFTHLDKNIQVDVIYTDFAKAFDRVNHSVLLSKLHKIGIHGKLLTWIATYLSNRSYVVSTRSGSSASYVATSGVPQGSHLGPLLFNIFINDLPSIFKYCKILLYADDLKIFHLVSDSMDTVAIQTDLNSF